MYNVSKANTMRYLLDLDDTLFSFWLTVVEKNPFWSGCTGIVIARSG